MKKILVFVFSLLIMFVLNGCAYKKLANDERIYISENSTRSLIFNKTEYGYNTSTSFYVITTDNNNTYIKQGKIYNDEYTYYQLAENRESVLNNAINGQLFFNDDNGLQSLTNYDNENVDHSVSYVQNGFGEVIHVIGTSNFISSITTEDNQIHENVDNINIKYAGILNETIKTKDQNTVIKKEIVISYVDKTLRIDRVITTKIIDKDGKENTLKEENTKKIVGEFDIKKTIFIDYEDISKTIFLLNNNEILSIDNHDWILNRINTHTNVSYFESVNNHFYVLENNILYLYDADFNLVFEQKFDDLIIGSTWLKERSEHYIRVATIDENQEIMLHKIKVEDK